MNNFTFFTPTKVFFGPDSENDVGNIIKGYGFKKILLHYGGGSIKKTGLYDRIVSSLNAAGISFLELGGVSPNPKISLVREAVALCKKEKVEMILAVGGGSAIDSAKAVACGAVTDIDPWQFSIHAQKPVKTLPVGVILTIAASGSEMSNSCVISDETQNLKRGFNTDVIRPLFAIMDPKLTFTVSPYQTACGIVDIMMHTLERYFTMDTDFEITDYLSLGLLKAVYEAGMVAMQKPDDYNARANLMWAGSLSHNGLTGAGRNYIMIVHLLEHEVSGAYDFVAHGAGLAILFPAWAKYAYKARPDKFADFGKHVFGLEGNLPVEKAALEAIDKLEQFFKSLGMPTRLSDLHIGTDQFETMADRFSDNGQKTVRTIVAIDKKAAMDIFNLAK
jgi:alcohol dehydrogenase YqhD (iron-dependent ADH family)